MQPAKTERFFSIELNSMNQIKTMSLANEERKDAALIEGSIGTLKEATFTEGVLLEVVGSRGTLRLDIRYEEIKVSKK